MIDYYFTCIYDSDQLVRHFVHHLLNRCILNLHESECVFLSKYSACFKCVTILLKEFAKLIGKLMKIHKQFIKEKLFEEDCIDDKTNCSHFGQDIGT